MFKALFGFAIAAVAVIGIAYGMAALFGAPGGGGSIECGTGPQKWECD